MILGIVGGGVVGQATARAFLEWAEVRVYDVVPERRTHGLPDVLESDLILVSLPTPQSKDGLACDTSFVERFFAEHAGYGLPFVLRSTVPIGTTKRLREKYDLHNLVHSPEFLTARCSLTDAQIPSRNIIGGEPCLCRDRLETLYRMRFPGAPVYVMRSCESEAVKNIQNAMFATKIAFLNEAKTLTDARGLDWRNIITGILADGRIAHSHTLIPGPDGKSGYGGVCLPKDLASLVHQLEEHGLCAAVTRGAHERNKLDRAR